MADGPDDMAILQNAIKIGLQSLLLGYFATQALPVEDRGYVGCLETLTSIESILKKCNDIKCAESVKADTRDVLKAQLDDFRDHKCYFGYLTQKQLMKH